MDKFESYVDMTNVHSTMILDSGIEVARLTRETKSGTFIVTLEVRGDAKVYYENCCYKNAGRMPDELKEMLNNWKEEYSEKVDIDMNNWPEIFFWKKEKDKLVWSGESEVVDAEGYSEEYIKSILVDYMDENLAQLEYNDTESSKAPAAPEAPAEQKENVERNLHIATLIEVHNPGVVSTKILTANGPKTLALSVMNNLAEASEETGISIQCKYVDVLAACENGNQEGDPLSMEVEGEADFGHAFLLSTAVVKV